VVEVEEEVVVDMAEKEVGAVDKAE